MLSVVAGTAQVFDALACGLPRIYDSACLEILWMASVGASVTETAVLSLIQG